MISKILLKIVAVAASALAASFVLTTPSQATTATISNFSPSFGNTGITVTIYGTNFGSSTGSVSFNGTSAAIGSWHPQYITVTVPSGASTGLVSVTPLHGTEVSSTADFIVLATNGGVAMGAFAPQTSDCGLIAPQYDCITDFQSYVLPNIDGVLITLQWNAVDQGDSAGTAPGCTSGSSSSTCLWSALDDMVATYVGQTNWNASKKVGIVISAVTDGHSNSSTPAYVYTTGWASNSQVNASSPLDQCVCGNPGTDYAGSGAPVTNSCWNQSNNSSTNTSGMPAVWEAPFYVALQDFHKVVVAHLNAASYAPYIAYVRLGLSTGGEEYPHCAKPELESLVSPSNDTELYDVWTAYADSMFTYANGLPAQYPLMAAPNGNGMSSGMPSDAWADTEAQDALNEGLSLGSEGLQYDDSIETPCSNDWCNTFTFTPTPEVHELQTYAPSMPSQTICGSSGGYGANDVNSLTCLLPFIEGKANSFEPLLQDAFLAYDPHYGGNGTYGSAYATAISNYRAGR